MNQWIGMGRLTKDPEVRYSSGEKSKAIARYTLAVEETRKKNDGTKDTNFIPCVAFDKLGEFAERYLHKGTKILVSGRIKTGSYTNRDGQKVYTTEIYVESQEFAESKQSGAQTQTQNQGYQYQQNMAPQTQGYQYQQMPNPQYAPVQQTVTQATPNQNYGYQMPQNPVPTAPPMTNEQFMQIPSDVNDGSLPFA